MSHDLIRCCELTCATPELNRSCRSYGFLDACACRERSTNSYILPLENEWEWERERESCSLLAGDDENTEQVTWHEWYKLLTSFMADSLRLVFLLSTLWPWIKVMSFSCMEGQRSWFVSVAQSYQYQLWCYHWKQSGRWEANGAAWKRSKHSSTGPRWSLGPHTTQWRNPQTLSHPALL